ncbi:MAG: ATP-dependent zinc protease [Thiomicrospira sp.]|uniref:ATP-dependent zinc protease family protein n=1 Tax=Thiomicrospira sp. TaxID=935 RepID=UPI001A0F579B|nr:ATP-dependent zinc protease [Thiomicrospira sp.]MBE0494198.1 ATP-dependent zinc protease [Thiomicrospira sp.]
MKPVLKSFIVFPFLLISLSACVPSHVWIKQADLISIETRLAQVEEALHQQTIQQQAQSDVRFKSQQAAQQEYLEVLRADLAKLDIGNRIYQTVDPIKLAEQEANNNQRQEKQTKDDGYIYVGDKLLVGEIETVHIMPSDIQMLARIDSGATTSSLDARHITRFERDGKDWVRFDLVNIQTNDIKTIERPLERNARIVQSNTEEQERRPVVLMSLTLGDITQMVEFTLSDRQHLTYAVLIGRNVMKDIILVDVGKKNIAPPKISTPSNGEDQ